MTFTVPIPMKQFPFPFPPIPVIALYSHSHFYRVMHVVLARYCYRMLSVRPSVCPSVCDVAVSWAHRLD